MHRQRSMLRRDFLLFALFSTVELYHTSYKIARRSPVSCQCQPFQGTGVLQYEAPFFPTCCQKRERVTLDDEHCRSHLPRSLRSISQPRRAHQPPEYKSARDDRNDPRPPGHQKNHQHGSAFAFERARPRCGWKRRRRDVGRLAGKEGDGRRLGPSTSISYHALTRVSFPAPRVRARRIPIS